MRSFGFIAAFVGSCLFCENSRGRVVDASSACAAPEFNAEYERLIAEYSIALSFMLPGYSVSTYNPIENEYEEFDSFYYTEPDTMVVRLVLIGLSPTDVFYIVNTAQIRCVDQTIVTIDSFGSFSQRDLLFVPERWLNTPVAVQDPNVLPFIDGYAWQPTVWNPTLPEYLYYQLTPTR